jgi:hypothetical protein
MVMRYVVGFTGGELLDGPEGDGLRVRKGELFVHSSRKVVSGPGARQPTFPIDRGHAKEWSASSGARAVLRESDDDLDREVDRIDEAVTALYLQIESLRAEKQAVIEAAIPRLKVARITK